MPQVKKIKLTIGGPESTPGTAVARTHVIPIRGVPGLDKKPTKVIDPVIKGDMMDAGEFLAADSVEGPIPLSPRACGGFGKLLKSLLGSEVSVQVSALIRIRYKGASASCKIVADDTANTLKSYIGALGSESLDTNFGTGGTIDLTAVATDTIGELVTLIEGYTDYDCVKVAGEDAALAAEIRSVTIQAKSMWGYLWFTSASSGAYAHIFTPDLTEAERPTYSVQRDGFQDNYLHAGIVVDSLSLSAALKAVVEGEVACLGFSEAGSQTASELILESAKMLMFYTGNFSLGEKDYTYLRNHSLTLQNQHNPEGYGLTSTSRQYHQKGTFAGSGDIQLRLDTDSLAERAKLFNDALAAISFLYKGATIAASVPEMMLVELPYVQYSAHDPVENGPVLDCKIGFKATRPAGTIYTPAVQIVLVTKDSGTY